MKRKLLLAALSLAVFTGAAAAKDNLAVLPFTGGAPGEGETIAELFSFSKELEDVFVPIPRTRIAQAIRNEQIFQTGTGMTDPDTIAALGKQLGAKYVVTGKIGQLGDINLLIISILKIDDLRQIAGDVQAYTRIEDIRGKLPGMARNIIRATEIDSSALEKLAVVPVDTGGGIEPDVADTLAQILSINLIRSSKYAVYPRTQTMEQVQREYDTQLSGITADENVVDMGKGDNPHLVLSVVVRWLGNQEMFNASIINLESGAQLIGRSVEYNTLDDGIKALETIVQALTGASGGSLSDDLAAIRKRAAASGGKSGEKASKRAGGNAFGYGVLNHLVLGIGSFIQGDRGGGLTILVPCKY